MMIIDRVFGDRLLVMNKPVKRTNFKLLFTDKKRIYDWL